MSGKSCLCVMVAILLAVFCFVVPSSAEEVKIAAIDTGKILLAHPAFQKAMDKYQTEVQSMQQKISEMKEEEQMSARQMLQSQMQELGMKLETEAFSEMRKDVKKIAEKSGFKYVMDINVLIVGGQDITKNVLSELKKAAEESPAKKTE